jgi:hypothetical protein
MALVQRSGLAGLLTERLTITAKGGANAAARVLALVAGIVVGADSIDDTDLLRHGGMRRPFTGLIARRGPPVRFHNAAHADDQR